MSLLACLCTNNTVGCAPCSQASRAAVTRFEASHPGATPGQLVAHAIAAHDADVVLGLLDAIAINDPLDPTRHDSASALMSALRACDARIVALVAGHAGFELTRSLAPFDRWRWAGTCAAGVTTQFLAIPGADPNAADGNGETLVHAAARTPGAVATLRELLARPGIAADAADASGMSPLHVATVADNEVAVELLLQHQPGVDVNNRNTLNRWTVLMNAAFTDRRAIAARLLARADLDVNATDDLGAGALHIAAEHGHAALVEVLLRRPELRVNGGDHLGRTPLSRAAFAGHADVVRLLLARADLEVNRVDRDRQTPLWWATAGKRADLVRLLLADPRVDSSITNRPARQRARDVAVEMGLADLVADLDRHAAAHPAAADQLDRSDPYVERSYERPPVKFIRPEPRRP